MSKVKLECQYCGKVYKTDRGLNIHVISVHKVGEFLFATTCWMLVHSLENADKFVCEGDFNIFNFSGAGEDGQSSDAPVIENKMIRCSVCDKTYKTQRNYQKHLLLHNTSG